MRLLTAWWTAFLCAGLIASAALLGRIAVALIADGRAAAVGLGIALLILAGLGGWVMIATLRDGLAHQRLARLAAEQGWEIDVSDLPRRASGRIERDAADRLFDRVRADLDEEPGNWVRWYRVARAYDYAGDRSRARHAMKRAVALREHGCA
jgi:hypothetical protein